MQNVDLKSSLKKLNLGCGLIKFKDFINIDINEKCKPDEILDISKELPKLAQEYWEEIRLFKTLEYISLDLQFDVLSEIRNLLVDEGKLQIVYPDYGKLPWFYLDNHKGKRKYWQECLYGKQDHEFAYVRGIYHFQEIKDMLFELGLVIDNISSNNIEGYSCYICVKSSIKLPTYEESITKEILGV